VTEGLIVGTLDTQFSAERSFRLIVSFSVRHLCGLERGGFEMLFLLLATRLIVAFPHSPTDDAKFEHLLPHQRPTGYSSLRFRLFVVLFILRTGTVARLCRFIFGWGASTINGWLHTIVPIIVAGTAQFREFPSARQQQAMEVEHHT
jgi:hypothetical protein